MTTPTEFAQEQLKIGYMNIKVAEAKFLEKKDKDELAFAHYQMAKSMEYLFTGMAELSKGVRATYILLEEVKIALQRRN